MSIKVSDIIGGGQDLSDDVPEEWFVKMVGVTACILADETGRIVGNECIIEIEAADTYMRRILCGTRYHPRLLMEKLKGYTDRPRTYNDLHRFIESII